MRSETSSFTFGIAAFLAGASGTLVVVRLNAASASVRASFRVLGRLGWSAIALNSFEQHRRQIALRERRHDRENGFAGVLRTLADLKGRRDRSPRGNAAGNALVARHRPRGLDRGGAVDLDDLVDHRTVEDLRNEAGADALNLVRRMLAAGQDRALLRLHGDDPQRRLARLQDLADSGDGAAGADAGHE